MHSARTTFYPGLYNMVQFTLCPYYNCNGTKRCRPFSELGNCLPTHISVWGHIVWTVVHFKYLVHCWQILPREGDSIVGSCLGEMAGSAYGIMLWLIKCTEGLKGGLNDYWLTEWLLTDWMITDWLNYYWLVEWLLTEWLWLLTDWTNNQNYSTCDTPIIISHIHLSSTLIL